MRVIIGFSLVLRVSPAHIVIEVVNLEMVLVKHVDGTYLETIEKS